MQLQQKLAADLSRRRFLKAAGLTGMGVAGLMIVGGQVVTASGAAVTDADVLNFALNLEYLEAEFYAYATTGAGIDAALMTGVGTQGATVGGGAVSFDTTTKTGAVATEIAADELNHVKYLRSALGTAAVAKPAINLAALAPMGAQAAFLEVARAFEDTGVTAYAGAAPLIQSTAYLQAAAQIFATEALHAGNVRKLCVEQTVPQITLDSQDIPPSATQYFSVDANALVAVRTTTQVLAIVYGGNAPGAFFPAGFNGIIK